MRVANLGNAAYDNFFAARRDLRGRTYYWLGGSLEENQEKAPDLSKDTEAVNSGWVTLTPLKYDLTDYETLAAMKKIAF
jgi:5'-nucleotidase